MKTVSPLPLLALTLAALGVSPLSAATQIWDTTTVSGIVNGSGTWDAGTTANWSATTAGSNPLQTWTSGNTAAFVIGASDNNTVTLSGSVTIGGMAVTGTTSSGTTTITGGTSLVLGGDQTWSSSALRRNDNGASIRVNSVVSGTGNLVFDGRGLGKTTAQANADQRVTFSLGGDNTFSGSVSVTKGAVLNLDYTSSNGSRLDDSSDLILKGGSLILSGGSNVVETVGATYLAGGANTIFKGPSNTGAAINSIALGAITRGEGGTLDITNAAGGVARTSNLTVNGTLGGWMTVGGNRFATVSSGLIASTAGSNNNTFSTWLAANNVAINAAVSGSGDKTINTLRAATSGALTLSSGTLTVASGGIIGDGGSISGGNLTSGYSTGELFVHTPSALSIGSSIIDNAVASTKTILVKAGVNTLTLTGASTHTGGTIINSGTLALGSGASLGSANITMDGGTFTMDAASSITFNIDGTGIGQFDNFKSNLGTATLAGTLYFKFGSKLTGSWQLFSLADADSTQPIFGNSIVITGAFGNVTLTKNSGIWTGSDLTSGALFTFTESTGILNVSGSSIPEPTTTAIILGLSAVACLAFRRRVGER